MRRRLLIVGIGLTTAMLALSSSVTSPIDALDYTLQERFRTLDGFGMARIPALPQHVYEFDPQTPDEKAAVEDLRKQSWTVGLYLGGRGLQKPHLSEFEWEKADEFQTRRPISPPLVIAGQATPEGLPRPWELQAIGRAALEASSTTDRYEASIGRWSVDVRPIRANRAACFRCHTADGPADSWLPRKGRQADLRIGDAVGVAIYVYRRQNVW